MNFSEKKPIASLEELRVHLQFAIGLELATIPIYLSGLYSIKDGENTIASRVIQSVVIEEMLHMALAANVLNGIGGAPSTAKVPEFDRSPIPKFPTDIFFLPGLGKLNLASFSKESIKTFIKIETPELPSAKVSEKGYTSIGTFYEAIKQGIKEYATPQVFEAAKQDRAGCQVTQKEYYGAPGTLIQVTDQTSALDAINEIVRQGEGPPPKVLDEQACKHGSIINREGIPVTDGDMLADGWQMHSHYARFREIEYGRRYTAKQVIADTPNGIIIPIDWDEVYPMADNPNEAEYAGTDVAPAVQAFNDIYTALLDSIYAGFNGKQTQGQELREAVTIMWELKRQAIALMKTPSPVHKGKTVGAPFEYAPVRTNQKCTMTC